MALTGSVIALVRRFVVPEVRAMSSQLDDYLVHFFLITILGIALYQVIFDQTFGIAYAVAPWFASIWAFSPDPALMEGATTLTQVHVFVALTFFAYFPFTKLVHFWTYPINYFVRPYLVDAHQPFPFRGPLGIRVAQRQVVPDLYGLGYRSRRRGSVDLHRVWPGLG